MFRWKVGKTFAGTLALRIVLNVSRLRMTSSRESTQRLSAVLPCLIPMPYGSARNVSDVSFRLRSWTARPRSTVSSHMSASARPSRNERSAFVKLSVARTLVSLKQFFSQRS